MLYSHDDSELGGVKSDKEKMGKAFEIGAKLASQ
jgi:hypothetical protein